MVDQVTSLEDVLTLAREESRRLQHSYVGTEHILFALLYLKDPAVDEVIRSAGARRDEIRRSLEVTLMAGSPHAWPTNELPLSSRAKTVLRYAQAPEKAGSVGMRLLRALEEEGANVAAYVLRDHGVFPPAGA